MPIGCKWSPEVRRKWRHCGSVVVTSSDRAGGRWVPVVPRSGWTTKTTPTNLRISAATFYGLIRSTAITRKIISSPPRGVSRYWWWWWVTACDMRQAPVWLAELLLNNNSGELVPVADCSDSKWAAQPRWICPYRREFVCDSLWSCCPQLPSLQIVLIRCFDEKSEMIMAYFRQVNLIKRNSDRLKQSQQWSWNLQ